MRDLSKYIGKEYEKYDCFALVRDFYFDEYGLELRNYFDGNTRPDKDATAYLITTNKGDFEKIESPEYGAIVVINLMGYSCHIGICLGEDKLMHSIKRTGSCIESISKYSRMIEGYYKFRGQAHD